MSQKWAKVMAILALAWIIISVIWTSLLYFLETGNQTKENSQTLTEDELMKLIEEAKKSDKPTLIEVKQQFKLEQQALEQQVQELLIIKKNLEKRDFFVYLKWSNKKIIRFK